MSFFSVDKLLDKDSGKKGVCIILQIVQTDAESISMTEREKERNDASGCHPRAKC